jgi:uncharacterized membrane protein YfcA
MALPSIVGGSLGALLALRAGDRLFARLVPWLVLTATALFAAQEPIARALRARVTAVAAPPSPARLASFALFQLAVALYGGFFGAGIGILMLATLGLWGAGDLHQINGLKNLLAACINGVSVGVFAWQGGIVWSLVPGMAAASVVGAYLAASFGKRLPKPVLRLFIITVGFVQTFYYLFRQAGILPGLNFVSP